MRDAGTCGARVLRMRYAGHRWVRTHAGSCMPLGVITYLHAASTVPMSACGGLIVQQTPERSQKIWE